MNIERIKSEPGLVCTCSDLYRGDIIDSAQYGVEDGEEFMYENGTFFRCGECKPVINRIIDKYRVASKVE